jgi:hypothetical protein
VTRRLTHALAALYTLVGGALAHSAYTSWQHDARPHAALYAGAAVLLATAIVHHAHQRDELRHALRRIEALSRPSDRRASVEDGVVRVALAAACCDRWWTSCGSDHQCEKGAER